MAEQQWCNDGDGLRVYGVAVWCGNRIAAPAHAALVARGWRFRRDGQLVTASCVRLDGVTLVGARTLARDAAAALYRGASAASWTAAPLDRDGRAHQLCPVLAAYERLR